ncbi:radical SAM protein, partial [bacterium]|nr:radical SAM protein [bacterium]
MECVHTPELRYGEFSKELHKKAADKRIPISGSFELTFRCNLRCQHCYAAHGHQGIPGKHELSYEEIQRILDEIVDAGCLWFLITGGEPLMRRDFLDIYKSAKGKGLYVTLFTNGTMLTPRSADYLAEWRPFAIEISLYGRTQATYERVTGIPGSFSRCMRGIELLLERGLPLKLSTMLMTLNKHELVEMQAYAKSLDVEFRFDPIVDPGLENSLAPLPLRLSPEEVVQIERSDTERATLWSQQFAKVT